jgi:hypothetical protein
MKAKYLLRVFIFFLFTMGCRQIDHIHSNLNLDFEKVENGISIQGIREGRDEVLEKAIEIIKQESK